MRIAFYPAQSGKPWNGGTLDSEALGGSETAVIYVARGLAALGHEVIVFTRAAGGVFDEVMYVPFERARTTLYTLPLDVLVCARDPLPLIWQHRAPVTVLWHHDMPNHAMPAPMVDVFVSKTQQDYYEQFQLVPKGRGVTIYNGVDNSIFLPPVNPRVFSRETGIPKLVWTSNPERGLWHAAEVLRLVREEFPLAELHVYGRNAVYGWDSSYEGNFLPLKPQPGLLLHDALNKSELAAALQQMDMWVYPTWWPETYCIAAVEAQAAGLPVVASNLAALVETVRGGVLVGGNAAQGDEHLRSFAAIVVDLLKSPEKRREAQAAGLQLAQAMDWKHHVGAWQTLLSKALERA